MPTIDSFDVHYSKICRKLQERYICRFLCLYWVNFDRCCPLFNNIVKFFLNISEIFHEIFQGKKNHEILHHYPVVTTTSIILCFKKHRLTHIHLKIAVKTERQKSSAIMTLLTFNIFLLNNYFYHNHLKPRK